MVFHVKYITSVSCFLSSLFTLVVLTHDYDHQYVCCIILMYHVVIIHVWDINILIMLITYSC